MLTRLIFCLFLLPVYKALAFERKNNFTDYTVHEILQSRILEWVAFSFSRGSSQPRNWIQVSCIAGGFFTSWAIAKSWTRLNNFHSHFERKSTKIIWITNVLEYSLCSKHYSMYCFFCISIHELKQNLKILQKHALNISWRLENSNHMQFSNHRTNKNSNDSF